MNWRLNLCFLISCVVSHGQTPPPLLISASTNRVGFATNSPIIWELWAITRVYSNSPPTNLPPRFATNAAFLRGQVREYTYTNRTFHSYQAETLPYLIWTNFVAVTNGRNMQIWSERSH